MFELVSCKNGNNIKVREVEGKCVCIACRGFGTMWHRIYWNGQALITGGLYAISENRVCQKCYGVGFWQENNSPDKNRFSLV